jgi:hypothetical protein
VALEGPKVFLYGELTRRFFTRQRPSRGSIC